MKTIPTLALAFTFLIPLSPVGSAEQTTEEIKQSEEYKIGTMVKAISAALHAPERPASLETIAKYGTDSRYYVMIRGWLIQERQGTQSQLESTRPRGKKEEFQQKVDFLNRCIRRIHLE